MNNFNNNVSLGNKDFSRTNVNFHPMSRYDISGNIKGDNNYMTFPEIEVGMNNNNISAGKTFNNNIDINSNLNKWLIIYYIEEIYFIFIWIQCNFFSENIIIMNKK